MLLSFDDLTDPADQSDLSPEARQSGTCVERKDQQSVKEHQETDRKVDQSL